MIATIQWIDRTVRMPTKADANPQGCVLIWDENNGIMIKGWHNTAEICRAPVTHWATPPKGPRRRGAG